MPVEILYVSTQVKSRMNYIVFLKDVEGLVLSLACCA